MNPKSLQSLKINGIDCHGLNPEDKKRIASIGYWKWLDEAAVKQLARFRLKKDTPIITNAKLADEAREKQVPGQKRGPKRGSKSARGVDRKKKKSQS